MTSRPDAFRPPIADRDLPEVVAAMREAARELRAPAVDAVTSIMARRCQAYRELLDGFGLLLAVPMETSDLDLAADTCWAAIWPLAARSLSLGQALLTLVEAGYCAEAFPTARSIFETNRLLRVFCHPGEEGLVRQWLEGRTPKPSKVLRALRRIDRADDERRATAGEAPVPPDQGEEAKVYDLLSATGHASRESMDPSISHSLREIVIGPNPDYGMRAYHVSWAGHVLWEILFHVGMVFAIGMGTRFYHETIEPLLDAVADLDVSDPFPEEHLRSTPVEYVET